ncbi:glycosyltransferase family 2 protein [Flavobacterium sp. F372]|uniref:Glycosyltransferase family 2 protein n=1 Tax=Flavobacterium bernardetii TaxID=2813823 RepID=A0ABR7IUX5_9FLAO|nr:glycosyltransferase family 2 protein [Flavobacterium bernardetii]MBC5833528.1 glycosyltransferase family 2 protein [Flavobacterium bernardetii]NHF68760.1 glycosyltransferase family 2 protein [Flavobacterium bernardetii]
MRKSIAIVIPSYNEATNIDVLVNALNETVSNLSYDFKFVFVDDGSSDETIAILKEKAKLHDNIFYVELSRNFGHQNALKAGIDLVKNDADAIISMDGDMQHPPKIIPKLIQKWEEGYEVVYTIREEDKKLSYFKNKSSNMFYGLMNKLSDIKFEPGTADFRLIDKKVAQVFSDFSENELFIRGIINWVGFKQFAVNYEPNERFSGKSKYTFGKMMRFAIQGITSFSTKPLSMAIILGISLSVLAFIFYIGYVIYSIYYGHVISGWASVITTVVFFGGLNLVVLGIIGVYIGKLFMQSKGRPNYLISNTNYK